MAIKLTQELGEPKWIRMSERIATIMRERKKLATREALSAAALRLALERGPQNVRVDDIAEAAGVSPRTYNNYFSSKAEAITWRHLDRARRMADLLRARPPGEPLWASITCAAITMCFSASFSLAGKAEISAVRSVGANRAVLASSAVRVPCCSAANTSPPAVDTTPGP